MSNLLQFHDRYLAYLRLAKDQDLSDDPEVRDISRLTYEERRATIEVNYQKPHPNLSSKQCNSVFNGQTITS